MTPALRMHRGMSIGSVLTGESHAAVQPWQVMPADSPDALAQYRRLRRRVFVDEQGLFAGSDADGLDDDPRTVVLVARDVDGLVLGGVRLAPASEDVLGWWTGSRLAVAPDARSAGGIGPALIRAACAWADSTGVLRFDAQVRTGAETMFRRLGWTHLDDTVVAGEPHRLMLWPDTRFQRLSDATKAPLAGLLGGLAAAGALGGPGFVGDDGAPVPGSDLIAACDAIVPSLVERDPHWAGWCSVLVNINDLSAMGAEPVGLLDAVAGPTSSFVSRVLAGMTEAARAWGVPVLGGHTQLGVPAALSVTALGRTSAPVPAAGGRAGDEVRLTADLSGGWRAGHTGRQWDSTTGRSAAELRFLAGTVTRMRPAAAKDVSMAGIVGTLGMLAEASGCGAEIDAQSVPRPDAASPADWLSCFPGFGMLTADRPGAGEPDTRGLAASAVIGSLTAGTGVRLRWPDGRTTTAITAGVTGLGATSPEGDQR